MRLGPSDEAGPLSKELIFGFILDRIHGEQLIEKLSIFHEIALTFEKTYFSTTGLQKGIRLLALSLPRLYSELKACTVSLIRPMIPSI